MAKDHVSSLAIDPMAKILSSLVIIYPIVGHTIRSPSPNLIVEDTYSMLENDEMENNSPPKEIMPL